MLALIGGSVLWMMFMVKWDLSDESTLDDFPVLQMMLDGRWFPTIVLNLLVPVNEEIAFRAILFARCVRMLGLPAALVVQSVAFGVIHWSETSAHVFPMGLLGVVFSLTYYASGGSLLVPIALHVFHNSLMTLMANVLSPLRLQEQIEQGVMEELEQQAQWEAEGRAST